MKTEREKQQAKEYQFRLRQRRGATAKNSIKQCSDCGDDFVYTSGPQEKCIPCRNKHRLEVFNKWYKNNLDKVEKHRIKSKDNYTFGGNRIKALERDKFTCQRCRTKEDVGVHHKDGKGTTTSKKARNNKLDNLVSLCRSCHSFIHHHPEKPFITN